MGEQIRVDRSAVAPELESAGIHEVAPDLTYQRRVEPARVDENGVTYVPPEQS